MTKLFYESSFEIRKGTSTLWMTTMTAILKTHSFERNNNLETGFIKRNN